MMRLAGLLLVGMVLLADWHTSAGAPIAGRRSLKSKFNSSGAIEFKEKFRGGERACVVVRGNNAKDDLILQVFDPDGQAVVDVQNKGDLIAGIWYPPRDATYLIKVASREAASQTCYIALK